MPLYDPNYGARYGVVYGPDAALLTLVSLTVSPDTATVSAGGTQQFTVLGTYNDSSTADLTAVVTWDTSDHAKATINSAGLMTAILFGTLTVSATLGLVSDSSGTITINTVPAVAQALGAYQGAVIGITVPWPTHQAGDIGWLMVESANEAITLTTANGFVECPDSPQGVGAAPPVDPASRLALFWCRATSSSMASPVVADSGDHNSGVIFTTRGGCVTGNPYDVTAGDTTDAVGGTVVTIPGDTSTVPNGLVLAICSRSEDSSSTTRFSAWTNADLGSVTEVLDNGTAGGNGGGIGAATGTKAVAGAFGATTATLGASSVQAHIMVVVKPLGT